MGTRSFLGVKRGWGMMLTPHPLLVPWSRKSGAIPLLPLWAVQSVQSLSACTRVHFTFFLMCLVSHLAWCWFHESMLTQLLLFLNERVCACWMRKVISSSKPFHSTNYVTVSIKYCSVTKDKNPVLVKHFCLTLAHELLSEVWQMFCGERLSVSLLSWSCASFLYDVYPTVF